MTAPTRRRLGGFATLTLGLALIGVLIAGGGASAAGADRMVEEVEGIGSCAQLAEELDSDTPWRGVRLGSPRDGVHSDGIVSVEIAGFSDTSFDWSSDLSLDAVLLGYESASGQEIGQVTFSYVPEAFSDSDVGLEELHPGATITEITFCHDPGSATTTTTLATTTTVATTTTAAPTTTTEPPTTTTAVEDVDELAQTGSEDLILAAIGLTLVALGTGVILTSSSTYRQVY